jgi:prepilin-type N-terminal cleavage/methylation domain-containing protein
MTIISAYKKRTHPHQHRPASGFSLLEIAVVLTIIAIILSILLPSITGRIAASRLEATRGKQELIKTALIAFVAQNKRLPCPAIENLPPTDANYGREATVPGTCTGTTALTTGAVRGIVPWLALGVTDDLALDGYYQRYSYVVTTTQTNLNANTVSGMAGNMTMHSATPVTVANQININNLAVVALISHGSNTAGAFTPAGTRIALPAGADELENTDAANTAFVNKDLSQNAANPFDDVVLAITPTDILNGLERSGVKPASGAINEKFAAIRNAVLAFVVADIVDPDGVLPARNKAHRLPAADVNNDGIADGTNLAGTVPYATLGLTLVQATDPWGNAILYTAGFPALVGNAPVPSTVGIYSGTAPANAPAFTVTSRGPNGVLGDADDLTFTMSVGELRGLLISNNQLTD